MRTVSIDGPAGAGKSTIAKLVAKELGAIYIDTGAMYRAMALYMLRNNIDTSNENDVIFNCSNVDITIKFENGEQVVCLNGENVNGYIRNEEVGNAASTVSKYIPVRQKLVSLQREIAKNQSVVMDGRDIGTVVLPNANPKIFLTASSKERARRRTEELKSKGLFVSIDDIEKDIIERDYQDMNREVSPLKKAPDGIEIDSSNMSIEQVKDEIIKLCK